MIATCACNDVCGFGDAVCFAYSAVNVALITLCQNKCDLANTSCAVLRCVSRSWFLNIVNLFACSVKTLEGVAVNGSCALSKVISKLRFSVIINLSKRTLRAVNRARLIACIRCLCKTQDHWKGFTHSTFILACLLLISQLPSCGISVSGGTATSEGSRFPTTYSS